MKKFVIRRLIQSLFLLWFVMSLSFLLINAVPGGPELTLMTNPRITQADMDRVRQAFGLNDPIFVQYFRWLFNSATLNFGFSYKQNVPVLSVIGERIGPTLQLGVAAYLFSLLGIPLGIYAALRRGRLGDAIVRVATVLGSAMPSWWLALMLIVILSNTIHWFPQGQGTGGIGPWFINLLIPALTLSTTEMVRFCRLVRSETLEVVNQDYVRTANAKGMSRKDVTTRHILRNSLIPVVTLFASFLPTVLSGAVITEVIFQWPGMGRLFFESANARDYPVVLTIVLIGTICTIAGTFLCDIAYGFVDPRIRYL
jgi:peptide/nickel transport system permease protein